MTLADVTVTDPHAGLGPFTCDPAQPASLVPGATMTCTAGYTTTQADLDAGSITNTGTVTGTPPTGPDVTAADTATVTATQTPNIDIVKSADPTEFGAPGTPITYTYLVTNNGNVTLADVTVTDPHAGLGPFTCDPAQPASLVPGATMTCTAGYTTTQADLDAGSITNTGTVTGTPPTGPDVTAADTATVTATQTPNIDIVKSADPTEFGAPGTPITYTYLVTNNGNVTLADVTVTDPHAGLGPFTCDPAQPASLVPGATMTCTAGYTTTQADLDAGSITNTGTVTGTPPTGPDVTAADTATVTATQTPNIDIVKSADPTEFGAPGTPITYTYLVTNNGNVTLADVTVTDPHAGLGPFTCDPAQPVESGAGRDDDLHGRLHHHPGRPGRRQHHQHRHGDRHPTDRAGRHRRRHRHRDRDPDTEHRHRQVGRPDRVRGAGHPDHLHLPGHQQRQRDPGRRDRDRPARRAGPVHL